MPEDDIPESLREVLPVRRRIEAIAAEAGLSVGELAARYVLGQHGVTCVLTGVETVEQVRANVELFKKGPLEDNDVMRALENMDINLSDYVLTPAMWE